MRTLTIVFLTTMVVLLMTGYEFMVADQGEHFLLGFKWAYPGFARGDWRTHTIPHIHYTTSALVWLGVKLGSLPIWIFLLQLLTILGAVAALFHLGSTLQVSRGAVLIAIAILLFFEINALGAIAYFNSYFNAYGAAMALTILAVSLALRQRYIAAVWATCACIVIHNNFGLNLFGALLFYILWQERLDWQRIRRPLIFLFGFGVPLLLLFVGPLLLYHSKQALPDGISAQAMQDFYYRWRAPHHYWPISWRLPWIHFGYLLALIWIGHGTLRRLTRFSAIIGGICGLAFFFTHLLPVFDALVRVCYWRMTIVILCIMILLIAQLLLDWSQRRALWPQCILAVSGLFVLFHTNDWRLALLVGVTVLLMLSIQQIFPRLYPTTLDKKSWAVVGWTLSAFCLIGAVYVGYSMIPHLSLFFYLVTLAVLLIIPSIEADFSTKSGSWVATAFLLLLSILALGREDFHLTSIIRTGPPQIGPFPAMRWIRDHTPAGARFITPAFVGPFTAVSHRAVVVSYKNSAFVDPADLYEWRRRLMDVTASTNLEREFPSGFAAVRPMVRRFFTLSPQSLFVIGRRYDAGYLLTHQSHQGAKTLISHRFRLLHVENGWVVLRLPATKKEGDS